MESNQRRQGQTEQPSRIVGVKQCRKRVKHVEFHVVGLKLAKMRWTERKNKCQLGITDEESEMHRDNEKMIQTSTFPYARLHKRHSILLFHYVRSMIARGFILMMHIPGKDNCADILTKHWGYSVVYPLLRPIFHFCGNTGDLLQDDGSIM
eukprot:jgi/Psemu1/61063/gm1.61063_g